MIIENCKIILPNEIRKGNLLIENKKIADILPSSKNNVDDIVFDAKGMYLCSGFIDIHSHGGGGVDFLDDTSFDKALQFHAENGTTAMLASALTSPPNVITDFCEHIREEMQQSAVDKKRSKLLGAHIEGPFLSNKNKGAQPENCLLEPQKDDYGFLLQNSDVIKTVTLAPELDGADKMVTALTQKGIVVCGGHDNGRKSKFINAVNRGVTHLTHLWCAMSTVAMYDGTREVGLCEYGLVNDNMTVEIIADNHHMTSELVQIVYRCKGADKMCIVSDCLRAGGMPLDGRRWILGKEEYKLTEFIVSDGVARLPDNTRLAGSIQPLGQMVKNLIFDCNIPICDAIKMATLNPAKIINISDDYGSIEVGKYADLCLLDENFNVSSVFIDGNKIY